MLPWALATIRHNELIADSFSQLIVECCVLRCRDAALSRQLILLIRTVGERMLQAIIMNIDGSTPFGSLMPARLKLQFQYGMRRYTSSPLNHTSI